MAGWPLHPPAAPKAPPKAPGNYASGYHPYGGWHPPVPAANPGGGKGSAGGSLTAGIPGGPPAGSFDPGLEAQRRAAERGAEDTLHNLATQGHFAKVDLSQALRDIHTSASRKFKGLGRDFARGNEKLGNQTADTQLQAARQQQDFETKRNEIARQFGDLAHRQTEASNSQGSLDAGTSASSAAARARNQQLAEAPIATGEGRLAQDLATSLHRLGIAGSQLGEDFHREVGETKHDRNREQLLSNRAFNRGNFERKRTTGRTEREAALSNADYLEQEIYDARREHPAIFAAYQRKQKGRK